ncbi:MAG: hypothetical protein ACOC2W_04670, partial [bacterium]
QGDRYLTEITLIQRAISILPNRPEGYLLLSKVYEKKEQFHDSYMFCCLGLNCFDKKIEKLEYIEKYFDKAYLLFQKSISAWWIGLTEEAKQITFDLYYNYNLPDKIKSAVQNNLNTIGIPEYKCIYKKSYLNELKYKFNNVSLINNNFSQSLQDMFVLTILNGKQKASYLEINMDDPIYNSNTLLLESVFNWNGLCICANTELYYKYIKSNRSNLCILTENYNLDYAEILNTKDFIKNNTIDYLQINCESSDDSLNVLNILLKSKYKFNVITFNHDYYLNPSTKELSRNVLKEYGYNLIVNDVSFNKSNSFEDWWTLNNVPNKFKNLNSNNNMAFDLFFKA